MIQGYKIACYDKKRVLVVLQIPSNAKTNLQRPNVIDANKAAYRCDRAQVVKIQKLNGVNLGEEVKSASSMFYTEKSITYEKGKMVTSEFDPKKETGIHFFIDQEAALYYHLDENEMQETINEQKYESYTEDGLLIKQCFYFNGKLHGQSQMFYSNKTPMYICSYDQNRPTRCIKFGSDGSVIKDVDYSV